MTTLDRTDTRRDSARSMAFRDGRMGVDQILAARPERRASGLSPMRPAVWS